MIHFLLIIFAFFTVSGCATMRKDSDPLSAQNRVSELEKQVQEKDNEIRQLKSKVEELSLELHVQKVEPVEIPPKVEAKVKDDGTIRVDAAPVDVQTALKNAGYYSWVIDGKIGERTKKAIRQFQLANGLTADGVIGKRTWKKLRTYLDASPQHTPAGE